MTPYTQDADGDGFCDMQEDLQNWDASDACNPNDTDEDGDGWCAGMEMASGWSDSNPCLPINTDTDGDGYCDMEELLFGYNPEDACSPEMQDTDGDGMCDVLEIINGTSPFAAESTLSIGDPDSGVRIVPAAQGFSVQCADCLGQPWSLFDPAGRVVDSGKLAAWNAVSAGSGAYVLSLSQSGFNSRLILRD